MEKVKQLDNVKLKEPKNKLTPYVVGQLKKFDRILPQAIHPETHQYINHFKAMSACYQLHGFDGELGVKAYVNHIKLAYGKHKIKKDLLKPKNWWLLGVLAIKVIVKNMAKKITKFTKENVLGQGKVIQMQNNKPKGLEIKMTNKIKHPK